MKNLENKYTMDHTFDLIRKWASDRGIFDKDNGATRLSQLRKLDEEREELNDALINSDQEEIKDAIGDCVVCLTNLAELCNLKIEDCINHAYDEIKDRKGKMIDGQFVKEKDLPVNLSENPFEDLTPLFTDKETEGVDDLRKDIKDVRINNLRKGHHISFKETSRITEGMFVGYFNDKLKVKPFGVGETVCGIDGKIYQVDNGMIFVPRERFKEILY